ncbi:Pxp2p Ecym_7180 [Eremothecium cymbalariae DBVPG|uniref:Carboxymuconolactone decarboxylase-like domain-containing protein n=1 Tax=Eremothecium cymbalariae (strain CBS 270.75 / DBVPG 7215 / KCTC 17166 / NRRL Y-17582) TaxID=931890 RepID=G8JW13_ERECY|nr:hypothetical protein Ecym_7180 [Eremothecium cymbalariae DBVPG\
MKGYLPAPMGQVLNVSNLLHLSSQYKSVTKAGLAPRLDTLWYLVAAATFTSCNEPKEIPKLYHFALLQEASKARATLSDEDIARQVISLFEKEERIRREVFSRWYQEPTSGQLLITKRFREAILRTSALSGLPKAINSLRELAQETPENLLPFQPTISSDETDSHKLFKNVHRDIDMSTQEVVDRGMALWNRIYGKVSNKVINNLNNSYPDLWYHTMAHIYGPLLSEAGTLDPQELSMIIIASLVPQDVNAQLWGHLKGASNLGCDREVIDVVRDLSITISRLCNVNWKMGITKL